MTAPLSLPLDELEQPVRIRSRALGADLWVVPDECAGQGFDSPTYTVAECRLLLAMDPSEEQLRAIHLSKAVLEGELVLPRELGRLGRFHQALLDRYHRLNEQLAARYSAATETAMLHLSGVLSSVLDRLDELEANEGDLP